MKLNFLLLISISVTVIYGQDIFPYEECKPVNTLLKKEQSYNCCIEDGVKCQNGHIIEL